MKAIDYCEKIFDGTHDSPKPNAEGKHYLINSKNISTGQIDYNGAYKISDDDYNKIIKRSGVKKGDILISMIGTIGNLCIVDDDSPDYAIKNMGVFRCKNSVDRNKLFYYLQTNDFKQKSNNFLNSSIQKFLTLDFIRNLDIQKEILDKIDVDKLTRVDLLIKHNNDVINVLINKIKDIYSYWFIDCYAEKRFNDDNEFKQVSLIKNDMCSLISTGIEKFNGYKKYFSTSEVLGNDYSNSAKKISYDNRESRANMRPKEFSVWFAKMKKSIKHIWFGKNSYLQNKIILSTGFAGLKCSSFSYSYIWSVINANDWFEKIKDSIATGSTQEAINENGLSYILIKRPTDKCLEKYSEIVLPMIEQISKIKEENDTLYNLKSDYLEKLFF